MLLAVRDLAADRVLHGDPRRVFRASAHLVGQVFEQRDALRGLREEVHGACEVELREVGLALHHDRRFVALSHQADHLGMAALAQDRHLAADGPHGGVRPFHALLEPRDRGARGVDQFDAQFAGPGIGAGGLAVGADEEPLAPQTLHVVVGDGAEPEPFEALDLDAVVHDVAQRADRAAGGQGAFGLADRPHHAEAEARFVVDLDAHCLRGYRAAVARRYSFINHSICSSTLMWLLSSSMASSARRSGDTARLMSARSRERTLRSISSSDTSSPLARSSS